MQTVNATLVREPTVEVNLETNSISDNTPKCVIHRNTVNCPTAIYHDKKTWLQSRHNINLEIQQLKQKLETLKHIRKHLKQKKPADDDNEEQEEDDDSEEVGISRSSSKNLDLPEFNELQVHLNPNRSVSRVNNVKLVNNTRIIKRKRKKPTDFENATSRPAKRRKIIHAENTTENEYISLSQLGKSELTTHNSVEDFTNPHRHQHRLHHTTRGPIHEGTTKPTEPNKKHNTWTTKVNFTFSSSNIYESLNCRHRKLIVYPYQVKLTTTLITVIARISQTNGTWQKKKNVALRRNV